MTAKTGGWPILSASHSPFMGLDGWPTQARFWLEWGSLD
jgi:hypothetical protein